MSPPRARAAQLARAAESTRAARRLDPRPTTCVAVMRGASQPRPRPSSIDPRPAEPQSSIPRRASLGAPLVQASWVVPQAQPEASRPAGGARRSCARGQRRARAPRRAALQAPARAQTAPPVPREVRLSRARLPALAEAPALAPALVQAQGPVPAAQAVLAAPAAPEPARAAWREVRRSAERRATASAYPNSGRTLRCAAQSPWTPSLRSCAVPGDAS